MQRRVARARRPRGAPAPSVSRLREDLAGPENVPIRFTYVATWSLLIGVLLLTKRATHITHNLKNL